MKSNKGRQGLWIPLGAALALGALFVYGGSLEPPGPPAPTFHTLDEIYDLLAALQAGGEGVATETRLKGCMTIDGNTQGNIESRDPNDQADASCIGEIRVISADHSFNANMHNPLVVTKHVDGASPLLYRALVEGEGLTDVDIDWYRAGEPKYLTIHLDNARVVAITPTVLATPSSFFHTEDVAFVYQTITWTWNANGSTHSADFNGGVP